MVKKPKAKNENRAKAAKEAHARIRAANLSKLKPLNPKYPLAPRQRAKLKPAPSKTCRGRGRPLTMPPRWIALVAAYGSLAKLATKLGVSVMTVWRWTWSVTPSPENTAKLAQLCKAKGVKLPAVGWQS